MTRDRPFSWKPFRISVVAGSTLVRQVRPHRIEAHKCLANVALGAGSQISIQGDDLGGGFIGPGYEPAAVDQALDHLGAALKLAPLDLSVHQGRLHVLEISGRYEEMARALEESCGLYQRADALDAWLPYTSELFELRQFRADLALLEVLGKHYPRSHEVMGNMGAVLEMLSRDAEAIPYLRRAVELAPADPLDTWNLAKAYELTGNLELADTLYQKAQRLQSDAEKLRHWRCLYSGFVEERLQDRRRACELQRANCPEQERGACPP